MKKLIIIFTVMCSMVLSMVGVLAATVQVRDSEYFRTGYYDNAYVIVTANQDDSTGKLSNIQKTKKEYGSATCTYTSETRGTTSYRLEVRFQYLGSTSDRVLTL